MDASVELNYPVDVVVSAAAKKKNKNFVMGSDELVSRDNNNNIRVSTLVVKEVIEVEESILVNPRAAAAASIQHCSSLCAEKDETSSVTALESTSWEKVLPLEHCEDVTQLPSSPIGDISKQLNCCGSNDPYWIPRPEEVQVPRKGGKSTRSSSGCSKRPRLSPLEDSTGPAGVADSKDSSDKLGSHPTKIDSNEKAQSAKQKNNFGSKRGDRRHSKVTLKTKYDSFSVKAGLASFGPAAGGNSFFGLCGLKMDVHDITKLVDHISLNDVLDGTYECPSFGEDKGKKAISATENFLHSVRKACFILHFSRPAQFLNFAETDVCSSEKMPTCPSNSVSIVENGDSSATDISSSNKDSCNRPETPANLLDFSFDQPKDTLERLALPPPKDLESLLLDATKLAASSRHAPDPRKHTSRRASLPAFPWSHTFSGQHSRTNSDVVKCLPSRSTCQGRWLRIGDSFISSGSASDTFMNLESFAYDESLVPSQGPKLAVLGNNVDSLKPGCGWGLSSSPASKTSYVLLESQDDLKSQGRVERCPRLFEAAQTLYDIATHMARLNHDGILRWPKKLSQKAMKARRTKSNEKPEDASAASTSSMRSEQRWRSGMDRITPSKRPRPKLSTIRDKKDLGHINCLRKGPINWSTPKSSRSSPNKSIRDFIGESRHSAAYILKESCMMPPPANVLNRTCNGQQKVRKLMQMD